MIRLPAGFAVLFLVSACGEAERKASVENPRSDIHGAVSAKSDSLLAAGREKYQEQDFAGARALWLASLPRARNDPRTEADIYTWLGLAAWRLGDLDSSRVWQQRAVEIKARLAAPTQLWRSYNALGLLALSEARNDSAATLFERALQSAADEQDSEGVAKATGNAALAYTYLGDFARARAGHRTMRAAGAKMRDARVEANGLANEAMVDIWEGDAPSAIARLDTARHLYTRIDAVGEQNALGQLASAYEITGDFGAAFSALNSALAITRSHALQESEVEILRMLGGLHLRLGDEQQASRYLRDAATLASKTGVDADLGSVLRLSAIANLHLGDAVKARSMANEALRLHRDGGEILDQIDDLLVLVEVDEKSNRHDSANGHLRAADSLARAISNPSLRSVVLLAKASIADRMRQPARVLAQLSEMRADSVRAGFDIQSSAAALATRAYLRLGAVDSAVVAGARSVRLVERVRGGLAGDPIKSAYMAARAEVYGDYIVALLRAGKTEEAFVVADRARSRALLEHLTLVRGRQGSALLPPDLMEGERLLKRIDALMESLRTATPRPASERAKSADATIEIVSKLRDARAEYEQLMIRSQQRDPEALALLGASSSTVADVKRVLDPGEILVEYFVAGDSLYTFVLRRSGMSVVTRPIRATVLAQRIRLLNELWGSPKADWRAGLAVSKALYAELLGPVDSAGALNGTRRLIVVPHGMLAQLPFAGLMNPGSGRYLMQTTAVLETPSSSALVALRRRRVPAASSAPGSAFAPFSAQLPGTAREVSAFREITTHSDIYLDRDASEASLRGALQRNGIVHVATHGVLNYSNPMFSRIELARTRENDPDDDGRLEVRELLGLRILSPLVFLSGCETGAFDALSGGSFGTTGDLALSQAFLSAGALNVLSTLWRIDDAGAAVLGSRFYRRLQITSASDALAGAQREMAADRRYASPYYWAGHVLSGEGRLNAGLQK